MTKLEEYTPEDLDKLKFRKLELWDVRGPHQSVVLRGTVRDGHFATIEFWYVFEVCLQSELHDVIIRRPKDDDAVQFLEADSAAIAYLLSKPDDVRLIIDSVDGTFHIVAASMEVTWTSDPEIGS